MDKRNRLMAFVSIAAMLTGCAKEAPVTVTDVPVTEDGSEETVISGPVSVIAGLPGEDTKTTYTYDEANNVMKVAWEKADSIFSYGNGSFQKYVQDGDLSGDGKCAAFTKTSGTLNAGKSYLFSYPVEMGKTSSGQGRFVLSGQTGAVEEMKNHDILTAKVDIAGDGSIPEISFSRRVAWLKITGLDFGKGVNTNITKVYLNGRVFNDYLNLNPDNNFAESVKCNYGISATPASPVEIKDGKQTKDLYLAFFPAADAAKGESCTLTVTASDNAFYQVSWETASAYTAGMMYALTGNIEKTVTFNIEFKDPLVKSRLINSTTTLVDINGDGEISNVEAALMTSLGGGMFEGSDITSFDEFQLFTGITRFDGDPSGNNGGFKNCKKLTSITLPYSIVEIGTDAFNGCESLKAINVPSSVMKINAGAFKDCTSLESVSLPDGITYMGERLVFDGCSSLKTVHWPKSCKSINEYSFQNCTSLESVELPEDLQAIGPSAFIGCSSLKSLAIPASVTGIGSRAFNDCCNLTNLTFAGSNYSLDAYKNLILEGTKAISCFGAATSITIPEDVTALADYLFSGLSKVTEITVSGTPTFGNSVFENNTVLKKVTIGDGCTSIGNYAFRGCKSLQEVKLPEGIKTLGAYLFSGCESLKNITLPSSITSLGSNVFDGCTSLESLTFSKGMTKIPNDILVNCTNLKRVVLEEGITEIGARSFKGCSGITSFDLPSTLTKIGIAAFGGCTGLTSITLPESVTSLGNNVFDGCTGLTELTIPNSVTALPTNLAIRCKNLVKINIPSSIKELSVGAFSGTGLKTFNLPETLTKIPASLFYQCEQLESIQIPETVTSIGDNAFNGCTSLKTVNIPDKVKSIGSGAFQGCTLIKAVDIPEVCTTIGSLAFSATGIETIDIKNVTSVSTAFANCTNLKSIGLGKITKIENDGFSGCSALTTVTIPATVKSIKYRTFLGCTSLKEVIIEGTEPCTITSNSFIIINSPKTYVDAIYVPDSAVAAYKATGNWATYYSSYIFAISTRTK